MASTDPYADDFIDLPLATPDASIDTGGAFTPLITDAPQGATLTDILNDGVANAGSFLTLIGRIFSEVDNVILLDTYKVVTHVMPLVTDAVRDVSKWFNWLGTGSWADIEAVSPGTFFYSEYLKNGLGVDPGDFDPAGKQGVKTVDTILFFALLMNLIGPSLDILGKLPLAGRWAEGAKDIFGKVPEEMGLSWALGLIIEKAFESALGTSIERNINRIKTPNEPEWQIARMMLRQHVIKKDKLDEILANAGFSPKWIENINLLESQPLPVGDIAALYQAGIIDADEAKTFLNEIGFTDEKAGLIDQLYIDKAETSAGAELRTIARNEFKLGLMSEDEYRRKLTETHFPERLIADDIAAVNLEKSLGWKSQQVGVIKSNFLHNPDQSAVATLALEKIGYPHDVAQEMVVSWSAPPIHRTHGLTESQVLRYYYAGVTLPSDALTLLQSIGIDSRTAQFLLDNPSVAGGVHPLKLTPGLVTQAYLVGAISDANLEDAYKRAGADSKTLPYLLAQARYKYGRHHEAGSGTQPLTEADIKEAFKYGLLDEPAALAGLQNIGYSSANALIILEIVNKGVIKPPVAPQFTSVSQAMAWLAAQGFTFAYPPDPTYEAAVTMVESAGINPIPPTGFTVPTTGPPVPGSGTAPPPPAATLP